MLIKLDDAYIAALQVEDRELAKEIYAAKRKWRVQLKDNLANLIEDFIESGAAANLLLVSVGLGARTALKELFRRRRKQYRKRMDKEGRQDVRQTIDALGDEDLDAIAKRLNNLGVSTPDMYRYVRGVMLEFVPSMLQREYGWTMGQPKPTINIQRKRIVLRHEKAKMLGEKGLGYTIEASVVAPVMLLDPQDNVITIKDPQGNLITNRFELSYGFSAHTWTSKQSSVWASITTPEKTYRSQDEIEEFYPGHEYPGHPTYGQPFNWDIEWQLSSQLKWIFGIVFGNLANVKLQGKYKTVKPRN
jgi:hypothetical protein